MTLEQLGVKEGEVPPIEKIRELLLHWISERYEVFLRRKTGAERPWTDDPVIQRTFFCNVHRENDKVSRWIRDYYNALVSDRWFEYNIIFSRFINWPDTLGKVGYLAKHDPQELESRLRVLAEHGKIWGGAYVITTHGIPMPKVTYLCDNVLSHVDNRLDALKKPTRCASMAQSLQLVEGIGSFLAAQIVADLKNTPGHKLYDAPDKKTFVAHGPGSLRGLSWFINGTNSGVSPSNFHAFFEVMGDWVRARWPRDVPEVDNQDLQNCLCEFDKYMRVLTHTGRSKRGYKGA